MRVAHVLRLIIFVRDCTYTCAVEPRLSGHLVPEGDLEPAAELSRAPTHSVWKLAHPEEVGHASRDLSFNRLRYSLTT